MCYEIRCNLLQQRNSNVLQTELKLLNKTTDFPENDSHHVHLSEGMLQEICTNKSLRWALGISRCLYILSILRIKTLCRRCLTIEEPKYYKDRT